MKKTRRNTSWLMLSVLLFFSCQYKKEVAPECGCGNKVIRTVNEVEAVYYGMGVFGIKELGSDGEVTFNVVEACNVDSAWKRTENLQKPDYVITGNLKRSCGRPDGINTTLWIGNQPIEVLKIKNGVL